MPKIYITIDTSNSPVARHAQPFKAAIRTLRDAYEGMKWVKAIMDNNQDGTNFADIETLFGLPAGKGQTVYDLVNGSVGSMEGVFQTADAVKLTEQVG